MFCAHSLDHLHTQYKLFSVKIELESTDSTQESRFLELNVFPNQSANDAVTEFLRANGISQNAREALWFVQSSE